MQAVRVHVGQAAASGNNLEFFIVTGSLEPPLVCAADNNGFPHLRDLYARQQTHQGKKGVHVSARFEGAAHGTGFAVNLLQPNMTGDYSVYPLV